MKACWLHKLNTGPCSPGSASLRDPLLLASAPCPLLQSGHCGTQIGISLCRLAGKVQFYWVYSGHNPSMCVWVCVHCIPILIAFTHPCLSPLTSWEKGQSRPNFKRWIVGVQKAGCQPQASAENFPQCACASSINCIGWILVKWDTFTNVTLYVTFCHEHNVI